MSYSFSFLLGLWTTLASSAVAQSFNFSVNQQIPDGDPTGLVNVQNITVDPGITVGAINVRLTIDGNGLGGFNGDLYVTLQHESGFSVLLNRVGRRSDSTQGYSDSGLNVAFNDAAPNDIHNYRLTLNGSQSTPLSGQLTGGWQPDGRTADPSIVLDNMPRPATLDSFEGVPVNGQWVLFVSDLSSGGTQQLTSWGMDLTPVPEPAEYAFAAGALLAAFAVFRKTIRRREAHA